MRSFIAAMCAACSLSALAQDNWHFTIGEEMTHGVSACLELADAKAIVNADRDSGKAAGEKAWAEADKCRNMMVSDGPKVGKVVYSVRSKRDSGVVTLRVVEILHPDGKMVIGYFITVREVKPAGRGV